MPISKPFPRRNNPGKTAPKIPKECELQQAAEDAVAFYTSLLPDSRVTQVWRASQGNGFVLIHFEIAGVPYTALEAPGGPSHTSAASIVAVLDKQDDADATYDRIISKGGEEIQCGWVTDAWGISWQIIPKGVQELLLDGDADARKRAHESMIGMKKLNLEELRAAAEGRTPP